MITIYNQTEKAITVTRVNETGLDAFSIEASEFLKIEPSSDLTELECEGTVFFAPTFHKNIRLDIIEDKELTYLKKKTDLFFIILCIVFIALIMMFVKDVLVFKAIFIATVLTLLKGVHSLIRNENIGNVVFIER